MRNYEEVFKGLKGISREELENRMSEIEKVKMQKLELIGRTTSEEGLNIEEYFSYPEYDSFSIKDCKREEKRLAVWGKIREPMEEEWDKVSSRRSELDKKLAEIESEYNAAKEIEDKHQALENELKKLEEYFAKYEKAMLGNNYQENKELFDKTIYKEKQARYKELEEERKNLPESNFKEVSEKTNKLREEYNAQDAALREDEDKIESKVAFFTDENNWETVMQMSDGDIREKITGKKERSVDYKQVLEATGEKPARLYQTVRAQNDEKEERKEKEEVKEEKIKESEEEKALTNRFEDMHPTLAKIPFLAKIANRFIERMDRRERMIDEYYQKYLDAYLRHPGLLQRFAIRNFAPMRSKIDRKIDRLISKMPIGMLTKVDYDEKRVELGELKQSTIDPNSRAGKRLALNKQLEVKDYNPIILSEKSSGEIEIKEESRDK